MKSFVEVTKIVVTAFTLGIAAASGVVVGEEVSRTGAKRIRSWLKTRKPKKLELVK
jgi:hypothetical protein